MYLKPTGRLDDGHVRRSMPSVRTMLVVLSDLMTWASLSRAPPKG